jgi:hypothetical protein
MRRRRARGETLLALIGVVAGFSGVLVQIGLRAAEGARTFPQWLRWTPPGALVAALTTGLNRGGAQTYALALATLAFYACAATWLTYRIAVRTLNSSGGVARSRATLAALPRAVVREGWRLPLIPAEVSTVFEKELRYAARNAQLRMMVLMPVVITVAMRFGMSSRGMSVAASFTPGVAPFIEGSRAALGIFYVFAVTSSITANCFGYDGAGMRAFVLSPVARRAILAGKNLAMLAVVLFSATLVTVVNQIAYGGLSLRATTFAALAFAFNAGLFFAVGNFFSVRFPRRMQFGKRVKASGTTGLLLVLFFLLAGVVPALAIIVGWLAGSVVIEYVILAAFACAAVVSYFLLLDGQGRDLARRELDILEAVAKHDD